MSNMIRATTTKLVAAVRRVVEGVTGLWRSHDQLMETSDLYRALVIAVTAALARQVSLHRLVLAIVAALINAWASGRDRGPWHDQVHQRYDAESDDGWSYA